MLLCFPFLHKNLNYHIYPAKLIFILLAFKSQARIHYWFCRISTFRDFVQSGLWFTHSSKADWFTIYDYVAPLAC
jgi:hypothetical protein